MERLTCGRRSVSVFPSSAFFFTANASWRIIAEPAIELYNKIRKQKEVTSMKIFLKIIFAPIIALLSVFIWTATKIVQASAILLNMIAIATALGAICIIIDGRTAHGVAGLIAAFLLTPFGLPLYSIILLGQVQRFKYWIQDCVYG